jgi:hypothetical protein
VSRGRIIARISCCCRRIFSRSLRRKSLRRESK